MTPVYLIGLGRIGAGNSGLAGDVPMSHLAALRRIGRLKIAGLIDPQDASRRQVKESYPDLAALLSPDLPGAGIGPRAIVVLATPPEQRRGLVETLIGHNPALIVMEKPIAPDAATAAQMVDALSAAGIRLLVNYHRRFDQRHAVWRERRPPRPHAAIVRYGKGLLNYAGHVVDLLCDWYGEVTEVQALGTARPLNAGDWSLSFRCRMAAGFDAVFVACDGLDYDQLEMDIVAPDGVLEWRAGGAQIAWREPVDDRFYRGYRHLAEAPTISDEGPVAGFVELYEAIADFAEGGALSRGCDGAAALKVATVLDTALASARAGGKLLRPPALH
jgi:predicted dehydrogenase